MNSIQLKYSSTCQQREPLLVPSDRPQAIESSSPRIVARISARVVVPSDRPQAMKSSSCILESAFCESLCSSRHCSCCAFGSSSRGCTTLVIELLSECSRPVSTFMSILSRSEYLVDMPRCRMLSTSSRGTINFAHSREVDHSSGSMTRSAALIIESSRRQTN